MDAKTTPDPLRQAARTILCASATIALEYRAALDRPAAERSSCRRHISAWPTARKPAAAAGASVGPIAI